MDKNMAALEILGIAIKSEEDASAFYTKISEILKNDLVSMKYRELAKEEMGHKAILTRLYTKLSGERPSAIPGEPVTAEAGFPVSVNNMEKILLLAISREQEANRFYSKAAMDTDDMGSRRILEYLSDMEKGHELMLQRELEAYLRDRDWYANNPDIQLVG